MQIARFALIAVVLTLLASTPNGTRFYGPDNMAFDRSGNMYVTDSDHGAHSRLLLLSRDGRMLWQWHGFRNVPGTRNGPEGLALDRTGNILVTDGPTRIFKISHNGARVETFANGFAFSDLGHIAIDRSGNVYVSEGGANRISKFSASGKLLAVWNRAPGSGIANWRYPETIAVAPNGNLVVEDWGNHRIDVVSPRGKTLWTFGGKGSARGRFINSGGLTVDREGNIYVVDVALHRVQIFDWRGRFLSTIANSPHNRLFTDGPSAIAVDSRGYLYSPDGTTIVTYTKTGRVISRWLSAHD